MSIKYMQEYRDADISRTLANQITQASTKSIRLMEVCGTHTVSIFRSGIRSLLPSTISLLSGPGCPVCVTDQGEIDAFIELAGQRDMILATFGDLIRVPGTQTNLQEERAKGGDVRVVYAAMDALQVAKQNPDKQVVFLGVGFETTAPTIAAAISMAAAAGVDNFSVFAAHKLVPPALTALMESGIVEVDGLILPGHVSVIIGVKGYQRFFDDYHVPCVVAGFEPADLLQAIAMLVNQLEVGTPRLENAYTRAVTPQGNPKAQKVLADIFEISDVAWRGLGVIPKSGLKIRPEYQQFDAEKRFGIQAKAVPEPKGCACGEILTGRKIPTQCALYKNRCTPMSPVGPCMVSNEGTCAAYYRYHSASNRVET